MLFCFVKERLDRLLDVPDSSIAVYWYARNCKRSEIILKGTDFPHNLAHKYFIHLRDHQLLEEKAFVRLINLDAHADMEIIDDDAERANIQFVKINDKRLGKSFGIKKFPALTMIRY